MVADRVVVETRRAGTEDAWRWSSDGKGSYDIEPLALDAAPVRGTRVILHINAASDEFLETYRIESLIREHSGRRGGADRAPRQRGSRIEAG